MAEKLYYNVFAVVDTTERELAPYPGGSATVPPDKYRKIYAIVMSNNATTVNTLTIRIYRGAALEASASFVLPASSTLVIERESPVLVVPPGRRLAAVASASSVSITMAGVDE